MRCARPILFAIFLAAACSSVTTKQDGAWRHCSRSPAAVHDIALGVFRELGYVIKKDRPEEAGFQISGLFEASGGGAAGDYSIRQVFECRPVGSESEIRLRTVSVYDESETARAQGAHVRLIERIENELRK